MLLILFDWCILTLGVTATAQTGILLLVDASITGIQNKATKDKLIEALN